MSAPALPDAAQLLLGSSETRHPPIYVKLTPDALAAVRADPTGMSLSVDGASAGLRLGKHTFRGSLNPEPGNLEIYVPEEAGHGSGLETIYRSVGRVAQRFVLRHEFGTGVKPTVGSLVSGKHARGNSAGSTAGTPLVGSPAPTPAAAVSTGSTPQPAELPSSGAASAVTGSAGRARKSATPPPEIAERVAHLLAVGEASPTRLAKRAGAALDDVRATLREVAEPAVAGKRGADDAWVLRDDAFRDLHIWSWDYSDADRDVVIAAARKAYARLGLPSDDAARRRLVKPKAKRDAAGLGISTTVVGNAAATSATHNGAADADGPPAKKARVDDDMVKLARKFRITYSEYAKLYGILANRQTRPPAQVQRLLSMHKELLSWKKRLWNSTGKKKIKADKLIA